MRRLFLSRPAFTALLSTVVGARRAVWDARAGVFTAARPTRIS